MTLSTTGILISTVIKGTGLPFLITNTLVLCPSQFKSRHSCLKVVLQRGNKKGELHVCVCVCTCVCTCVWVNITEREREREWESDRGRGGRERERERERERGISRERCRRGDGCIIYALFSVPQLLMGVIKYTTYMYMYCIICCTKQVHIIIHDIVHNNYDYWCLEPTCTCIQVQYIIH